MCARRSVMRASISILGTFSARLLFSISGRRRISELYINFTRVRRRRRAQLFLSGTESVFYFAIYSSFVSSKMKFCQNKAQKTARYNLRPKEELFILNMLPVREKIEISGKISRAMQFEQKGVGRRASAASRLGFSLLQYNGTKGTDWRCK